MIMMTLTVWDSNLSLIFIDLFSLVPAKPSRSGYSKLDQMLGPEYAAKVAVDDQPWYLRPNYSPSEIIIEPDGSVKGGTVASLVERLTAHEKAGGTVPRSRYLQMVTDSYSRHQFPESIPHDLQIICDLGRIVQSPCCAVQDYASRRSYSSRTGRMGSEKAAAYPDAVSVPCAMNIC